LNSHLFLKKERLFRRAVTHRRTRSLFEQLAKARTMHADAISIFAGE